MPTYNLPPKQEVADALRSGYDVPGRLLEVAEDAGYILGPGGIQVWPDGSVTIDTDRDPTEDWIAWNPYSPTRREIEDSQLRQGIIDAVTELDSIGDTALGATGPVTAAQLVQIRTAVGRIARIQEAVIRVLADRLDLY